MRRWFANPVTSLILLALLCADAKLLPPFSTVGRFLSSSAGNRLGTPPTTEFRVYNDRFAEVRIARIDSEIKLFPIAEFYEHPDPSLDRLQWGVIGRYNEDQWQTGWWSLTQDHATFSIMLEDIQDTPISEEQRTAARATFVDWLRTHHDVPDAVALNLRTADYYLQTPILSGYIHNTISLLVFIVFLLSLDWIPRYTRSMIRARRKARGQCTRCGYALGGLTAGTCPECGASTADAPPPTS